MMRAAHPSFTAAASLCLSPAALEWCVLWSCSSPATLCRMSAGFAQTNMFAHDLSLRRKFQCITLDGSCIFPQYSRDRVWHPPSRHFFHEAEKFQSCLPPLPSRCPSSTSRPILGFDRWSRSILSSLVSLVASRTNSPRTHTAFHHLGSSIFFIFARFTFASLSRARHSPRFKVTCLAFPCKTEVGDLPGTFARETLRVIKFLRACRIERPTPASFLWF